MEELRDSGGVKSGRGVEKEIETKLGSGRSFNSTISTMTSFQFCNSGLSHDQFQPILGMDMYLTESMSGTLSKRKVTENDGYRELDTERSCLGDCGPSAPLGTRVLDVGCEDVQTREGKPKTPETAVKDGIRTLYRREIGKEGSNPHLSLPSETQKILVNGLLTEVIPSMRSFRETRLDNIPSGFRDSNQLVEYFVGKVLRSSESVFYIDRKLQQALYGAVFLAFELERDVRVECPGGLGSSGFGLQKESRESFRFDPGRSRVAIKVSSMSLRRRKPSLKENMEAEVMYSQEMRCHKNVLEYSEIWQDSFKNIYIKMEFAEFEDLFEVMRRRRRPLTEGEARWLFRQIFYGVVELHKNNIAMRDLSLENILMYKSEPPFFESFQESDNVGIIKPGDAFIIPKITDPGQACRISPNKQDEVSRLWRVYQRHPRESGFQLQKVDFLFGKSFRPPEAYQTGSFYDPTKVDVFCLGWMLLYTLTKFQPFETCRLVTEPQEVEARKTEGLLNNLLAKIMAKDQHNQVMELNGKRYVTKDENWSLILNGKINDLFKKIRAVHLSPEVLHLVENMLAPDFNQRFSMHDVIKHPWLRGLSSEPRVRHFTPLMASTLSPPKSQKSSSTSSRSPNIVRPSVFFEKLDKRILDKVGSKPKSRKNTNGPRGGGPVGCNKVNEHLASMVKKTNERLEMTRVSISTKRDAEFEAQSKNNGSSSVSPSASRFPEQGIANLSLADGIKAPMKGASGKVNPINHQAIKTLSNSGSKVISASPPPSSRNSHQKGNTHSVSCKKKNPDSNIILEIWSFFSGANEIRYSQDPNHIPPN